MTLATPDPAAAQPGPPDASKDAREAGPGLWLDSPEGQRLLLESGGLERYNRLARVWVPQLPSHCGAASAVVCLNALRPGETLTQDSLFTPETDAIITQATVYDIGFTNRELDALIELRTGVPVANFYAGSGEGQHGLEEFREALRSLADHPSREIIIQYSRQHLREGEGSSQGHFTPVGAYHAASDQVLMLEINGARGMFWIDAARLWEAMATVDPTDGMNRGWLVVGE